MRIVNKSDEKMIEIAEKLKEFGFQYEGNGKFWHLYFGSEQIFDLSATDLQGRYIMQNILLQVFELGKKGKINELLNVLNLNQ